MKRNDWKDPDRLIDITPVLRESSPVFPGDTPFRRTVTARMEDGDSVDCSFIQTTSHIGAHADAPSHYSKDGRAMHQQPLTPYFGLCQVTDAIDHVRDGLIPAEFVENLAIEAPRVLFRTGMGDPEGPWSDSFAAIDPAAIDSLGDRGVRLVGLDSPSVDPADSKTLEAHRRLFARDMANLEGLDLREVEAGLYLLSALPLRIEMGDGSPVRAVLAQLA